MYCAAVLEYIADPLRTDGALSLALVTGDELIMALANRHIATAQRLIREHRLALARGRDLRMPDQSAKGRSRS
jgi:hypothetical protein